MLKKNKLNLTKSMKKIVLFASLGVFSILPAITLISCSSDAWNKKPQKDIKDNEWNQNDPYDKQTDGNGTGDGKPKNYKYYELEFLKQGENKPFRKAFKSKDEALKYYQNSTYLYS